MTPRVPKTRAIPGPESCSCTTPNPAPITSCHRWFLVLKHPVHHQPHLHERRRETINRPGLFYSFCGPSPTPARICVAVQKPSRGTGEFFLSQFAWFILIACLFPGLVANMACLIPLSLNTDCQAKRYTVYFPCNEDMLRRFEAGSNLYHSEPKKQLLSQEAPSQDISGKMKPIPRTNMEWKATLGEIKRDYMNRRFRQCSARCHEILDHSDKLVSV